MFRLIFIDIDGTLLTSEHRIAKNTRSAIHRVSKINKIPVILVSARAPQGIQSIYDELDLKSPVVCFNGALLLDKFSQDDKELLQVHTIESSILRKIGEMAIKENISFNSYETEKWICDKYNKWILHEEEITGTKAVVADLQVQIDRYEQEKRGPNKILLMGDPVKIDAIEELLKLDFSDQLNIYKSKPDYLEIMNSAASKKSAMSFLLQMYNLTSEDAIAIGDNHNDIDMLQYAGLGIAMGNAPSEVKSIADFITLDNNSEGIYYALEKFIK